MKIVHFLSIYLLVLSIGCHTNENEILQLPEGEQQNQTDTLTWAKGFPSVYAGSHSMKIAVAITKPGKVYYVITEKALESPTSSQIKKIATEIKGEENDSIIAGALTITKANLNDTTAIKLKALTANEHYYSYFIAEGQEGDSIYLLPNEEIVENVSYLPPREKEAHYFSTERGQEINYLFYALENYYLNPLIKYPLLIFLHGKGEYGNGGHLNFYKNGIIPELIHKGKDFPFVIVSPQIDTGRWDTDFVDEFIDYVIGKYSIDENRIYMTGNSLGGVGTWEYVGDYPDRLAAIVPISGEGDTLEACKFKDIPVWAFHNAEDGIVDPQGSISMINALNNCQPAGAVKPKLTIYPDKGHNAWIRTYDGSAGNDIYSWMLSYHRNDH